MLQFRNLTRAYELGGERAGVFDVSLEVPKGCLAVLAVHAGKTRLLDNMLIEDQDGAVSVTL